MPAQTERDGQDPQSSPSSSPASEERSPICRLWDVPPHISHHLSIYYLYNGSASKKRTGGLCPLTPWWGCGFLRLPPKDGLEPWGWWVRSEPLGGQWVRGVTCMHSKHFASPEQSCSSPGWAWFPHSLCLHKSEVTPQKSMEREKHVKQKSHRREPGQPVVLQRQERYLSLKEGWIHLSDRFCS